MERKPVEWLSAPPEEEDYPEDGLELHFRLVEEWCAVDDDQLILPIVVLDKSTITAEEPYPALLKQYGGESLLNDMLMSDQRPSAGSEWVLIRYEHLLEVVPAKNPEDSK